MEKELPVNWVETSIGKIGNVVTGNTPSKKKSEYYNGEIPWVKPADINTGVIIQETKETLSEQGALNARMLPKGAIMVTCIGNLGNIAIAGKKLATNQQINSIVINHDFINKKYAYYWSLMLKPWLVENSTSTTISMVNKTNFEKAPFLLPPLPEQQRIVAKLDQLFGHLDSLKTKLERIPQLMADFRQSVLTQAVTGKLTAEFPNKKILKEITDDRKDWYEKEVKLAKKEGRRKPKKLKFKVDLDKSTLEKRLVKKYEICFFDEIAAKKNNALKAGPFGSSLKKSFYVEKGYKIYGQEQVISGDPFLGDYYINETKYQELSSCIVEEGDILISLVGTIGRVLIIPENFEPGIINPRLVKLSLHEKVFPKFIQYFLQSPIAVDLLKSKAHGGTMDILNLRILKELPVPLPSYEEQTQIVQQVESLFTKATAIEERYQVLKSKIEDLPQAILAKAFRGELVEQLPTDGDAADLLAEIVRLRAELKTSKKKKPTRRRKS